MGQRPLARGSRPLPDGVCVTTYRTDFGGTHSGTHYSLYISMTYIGVCHVCHVCHLIPTYIIFLFYILMFYTAIQLNLVAHMAHICSSPRHC